MTAAIDERITKFQLTLRLLLLLVIHLLTHSRWLRQTQIETLPKTNCLFCGRGNNRHNNSVHSSLSVVSAEIYVITDIIIIIIIISVAASDKGGPTLSYFGITIAK